MLNKIKGYYSMEFKNKSLVVILWMIALGYFVYFIHLITQFH